MAREAGNGNRAAVIPIAVAGLATPHVPSRSPDRQAVKICRPPGCPALGMDFAAGRNRRKLIFQVAAAGDQTDTQENEERQQFQLRFHRIRSLLVTVAAEPLSFDPTHMSIRIRVTDVAVRSGVRMPLSIFCDPEAGCMRFRIGAFQSV